MTNPAEKSMSPFAVWVIAIGAGASGVSGFGAMGQLGGLQSTLEEQVRQAEVRGQLISDITSNRSLIDYHAVRLDRMMEREGIMELHRAQQALIEKLIDWTGNVATKNELDLAIKKLQAQIQPSE